MLELNIKDLRKKALIKFPDKPDGHIFGVREMTGGDELALAEVQRKRGKLLVKAQELQNKASGKLTEDEAKKATGAIDKLIEEIKDLEQQELKIRASVFDDFGDGTLAIALYNSLTNSERDTLIKAVVNGTNILPAEAEDGKAT